MIAVLAALGVVATVVVGFHAAPDAVRRAYQDLGVADPDVARSAWFWVAGLAAVATVATHRARRTPGPDLARDGPPLRRPG